MDSTDSKLNAALGIEDVETFLALKAVGMESAMDINALSAMEALAFKDWLEAVSDKIVEIIESGKGQTKPFLFEPRI